MKLNHFLTPEEQLRLSRDSVIAHEKLTILSREYVIEHGVFWDDAALDWDECGYYTVDRDGVLFTGLTYEVYDHKHMEHYLFWTTDFQDGTLMYYAYFVNGLQDGVEVEFYPSGAVQSYCVYKEGKKTGVNYEWYENGAIKKIREYSENSGRYQYTEFNKQGKITRRCVL